MNLDSLAPRPDGCPPPVILEYLAAGDAQDPATQAHVDACRRCLSSVATLKARAEEFRRAHPAERFLAKLAARRAQRPVVRWWILAFGTATALGLALGGVLFLRPAASEDVRLKGAGLSAFVLRSGQTTPERLLPGSAVQAGDSIRFRYAPPGEGQLMVLNLDGTGQVTVFHPFGAEHSGPVGRGSELMLPDTVLIDDHPGPERIAAVFRAAPFTIADVRGWLNTTGPHPQLGCEGCVVEWLVFDKP